MLDLGRRGSLQCYWHAWSNHGLWTCDAHYVPCFSRWDSIFTITFDTELNPIDSIMKSPWNHKYCTDHLCESEKLQTACKSSISLQWIPACGCSSEFLYPSFIICTVSVNLNIPRDNPVVWVFLKWVRFSKAFDVLMSFLNSHCSHLTTWETKKQTKITTGN